jgi:prevent-host-death family protein
VAAHLDGMREAVYSVGCPWSVQSSPNDERWPIANELAHSVQNGKNAQMTRLAATALRSQVADTLNRVAYRGERIALERHGKAVAALVSIDDLELLEALEDRSDLAAVRRALKEPGRRRWDQVKTDLGL